MLKSYEAIYDHGQLHWLNDKPDMKQAQVIVTIVEASSPAISGDAIHLLLNETRGAWGTGESLDVIDREIAKMRDEWQREWDSPNRKPDV